MTADQDPEIRNGVVVGPNDGVHVGDMVRSIIALHDSPKYEVTGRTKRGGLLVEIPGGEGLFPKGQGLDVECPHTSGDSQ